MLCLLSKMIISDAINHDKLQSIIVGELKKAGLKHRLKKIILKNIKEHKTVFGAPLAKVPSCSVVCCGSTLSVPLVVSEMSTVLRSNAHIEGLFRKAGSQNRQKDIKRLLDAGGCVSAGHHPIDVASVLKLYLRCLPEPLISAEVQDLLLRCRITAGEDAFKPILHTLLLLPVLHVHLLHYIMELLNFIAARHKDNLMDSSNLAIVMAPSIMPLPAASSAQRLEHHVALVKIFIENSQQIGLLTDDLMTQLDDDSDIALAKRKKRRSGSLNRMLNGLRKMVSGSVNTPAPVKSANNKTPVLSKSASKRKFDTYDGFSAKTKKQISDNLPLRELSFTPMKMGITERKRLRLGMMEARSTPAVNDFSKHSESSGSSEDMLTSSELLFSAHDTIDLSPDMKHHSKDYVRISKQEYEEIKNRVSAIENRLSKEFTDVIPREPLQHVQNVYEQTLEEVAMLDCPTSDHLARRLSKELKIRPKGEVKIIRSPSARKIGNIRRRSKDNITKIVRHKSWCSSAQTQNNQQNVNRFYPFVGITKRERTSSTKTDFSEQLADKQSNISYESSFSVSPPGNMTHTNQKYEQKKRTSLQPDYNNLNKRILKNQTRRSLIVTSNGSCDGSISEKSANTTFNISTTSNNYGNNIYQNVSTFSTTKKSPKQPKWKSAAAYFMEKNGEIEGAAHGRPSVNKLRALNAGAVAAKARLFESSSDKSSEDHSSLGLNGLGRQPKLSGQYQTKAPKNVGHVKPKVQSAANVTSRTNKNVAEVAPIVLSKVHQQSSANKENNIHWKSNTKITPPAKKMLSPPRSLLKTPNNTPLLRKPLGPPKNLRTPSSIVDHRKVNTPLKAIHISPRRKSPKKNHGVQVNYK